MHPQIHLLGRDRLKSSLSPSSTHCNAVHSTGMAAAHEPSLTVGQLTIEGVQEAAEAFFLALEEAGETRTPPYIELTSVELAAHFLTLCIGSPSVRSLSVRQTSTSKLVAGGFLHLGEGVHSIGPVFVHPDHQQRGVGKLLMQALIEESQLQGSGGNNASLRLTQSASNQASFGLYATLGFVPVECFAVLYGTLDPSLAESAAASLGISLEGVETRQMEEGDIEACSELFTRAGLGYSREAEIRSLFLHRPSKCWVAFRKPEKIELAPAERNSTGWDLLGHAIASNEEACIKLLIEAGAAEGNYIAVFNLLSRLYPKLLRWALASRLRLSRHSWYMVKGQFQPPSDSVVWVPNELN